jgi:hypothetical protein
VSRYRKFLVAVVGAVAAVAAEHFADNPYVTAVVAVLTALGVYRVPNA